MSDSGLTTRITETLTEEELVKVCNALFSKDEVAFKESDLYDLLTSEEGVNRFWVSRTTQLNRVAETLGKEIKILSYMEGSERVNEISHPVYFDKSAYYFVHGSGVKPGQIEGSYITSIKIDAEEYKGVPRALNAKAVVLVPGETLEQEIKLFKRTGAPIIVLDAGEDPSNITTLARRSHHAY